MQRDAWYLTLTNKQTLAIAQQQVVEYLTGVQGYVVPSAHVDCDQVILWRKQMLPLWGLSQYRSATLQPVHRHVMVISYLDESQTAQLLAISLASAPVLVTVEEGDVCNPTDQQKTYWKQALLSCFQCQGNAVPIVNFAALEAR